MEVIETLYNKFLAQHDGRLPEYEYGAGINPPAPPPRIYGGGPGPRGQEKPLAIIVDIDGTVSHRVEKDGSMRGPFDWDRVGEDRLDP